MPQYPIGVSKSANPGALLDGLAPVAV